MEYRCNNCNKCYSSYKSLWLHNYKYHNTLVSQKVSNGKSDGKSKSKSKNEIENLDASLKKYKCLFCNNEYKHKQSKYNHEKKCEYSKEKNNDILEIKKQNQKLEKQNEDMKQQLLELKDLIQKSLKIHPKTLQKINNQLINNTYINGDINNYVVQLGYEDLDRIMTEKEKIAILNKYGNCLAELVRVVHVSDIEKYKPFKNMYITNLQNNIAYKYDDTKKKFIAVTKSELLDSIIDNRLSDIESFHEDYKEKITPFTSKQINAFLNKMNDEKVYKENKKEEIKLVIYNGREEIINQIKENNPELNIFN
jgi:hypothetical protein